MISQDHHYYQLARRAFPYVVNGLARCGNISPQEAQQLQRMNGGPEFSQFVDQLRMQYASITDSQMEQLLADNFIREIVVRARECARGGSWGGGYNPGFGGGGMRPYGFGGGGFFGGGNGWSGGTARYGLRTMSSSGGFFGGGGTVSAGKTRGECQAAENSKAEDKPKPKQPWKAPELTQQPAVQRELANNGVKLQIKSFAASDNLMVYEAVVIDDRPRYTCWQDAVNSYKSVIPDVECHKALTICYREVKALKVSREDFKKLIDAVYASVSNIAANDLVARMRALIALSKKHLEGVVNAYKQLIVDEFNNYVLAGELTDGNPAHAEWMVQIKSVEGIVDLLTGNMSPDLNNTFHQIKNFDQALQKIVAKVLDTVLLDGMSRRIFDPLHDPTVLDVYGRAIPQAWINDTAGGVWEGTDNLFAKYVAANRAKNEKGSTIADQALQTRLAVMDANFCVIQVPRIITWMNMSSSGVASWGSDGKCTPKILGDDGSITSDSAYFLSRASRTIAASDNHTYRGAVSRVACEVEEGTIALDYGITTDEKIWVGSMRYRK